MPRKAAPLDADDIVQSYLAGEGMVSLIRRYRTSHERIRETLTSHGITVLRGGKTGVKGDVQVAVGAYLNGMAIIPAAKAGGIDSTFLANHLRSQGLFRSAEETKRIKGRKSTLTQHAKVGLPDAEIAQRYAAGETVLSLSQSLNTSRQSIYTSLKISGCPLRSFDEVIDLRSSSIPLSSREPVFNDHPGPHIKSWEDRCNAALNWERRAAAGLDSRQSDAEIRIHAMLQAAGIDSVPQQAVGPFNVDLGAYPVAVEVWGGAWHFSRDHRERFRYLLDCGWSVIIVYVDRQRSPISPELAHHIPTHLQELSGDPSRTGEYRVIWGSGELFAAGRLDDDHVADIVPRKRFLNRRSAD